MRGRSGTHLHSPRPLLAGRRWGSDRLAGRLVLHVEGGFGDAFQMIPWVLLLRERVETLTLLVHPELLEFLSGQWEDVPPALYFRPTWEFRPLSGDFRVGIVWSGNPGHLHDNLRSPPLAAWDPVLRTPGVRFYSLQLSNAARDLRGLELEVRDLSPELRLE